MSVNEVLERVDGCVRRGGPISSRRRDGGHSTSRGPSGPSSRKLIDRQDRQLAELAEKFQHLTQDCRDMCRDYMGTNNGGGGGGYDRPSSSHRDTRYLPMQDEDRGNRGRGYY